MSTSAHTRTRGGTLSIRIAPELCGLIDRAALLKGKNRTDFVLEVLGAQGKKNK